MLDETTKSTLFFLHMLQWLEEKGYSINIDIAWAYDDLLCSLNNLNLLQETGIHLQSINMLENNPKNSEIFTTENLILLDKTLRPLGYVLIDNNRDGDCYDLSVVSWKDYETLMTLSEKTPL